MGREVRDGMGEHVWDPVQRLIVKYPRMLQLGATLYGGHLAYQVLREAKDRAMAIEPTNRMEKSPTKFSEMKEAEKTAEMQRSVAYEKHRTPPLAYYDHK